MRGRVAVVALAVVATAGVARAQRTRTVEIDSVPTGATIYIDSKDDGPRGETPLALELAPGEHTIIAEKDTFDPEFASLEVPRGGKRDRRPVTVVVRLRVAMARLRVVGVSDQATVKIDDASALTLVEYSDGFDVTAGPHTVVVELDGKPVTTEFIDVESGTEKVLTIRARFSGKGESKDRNKDDDDDGDDDDDDDSTVTASFDPRPDRGEPFITVGPLFDFNWRKFEYRGNATTMTNLGVSQYGPLLGVAIELNPFRRTDARALRPLAIVIAGGRGFEQAVEADASANLGPLTTFWMRYQGGLRYRIPVGVMDLDLEGGYAAYHYRFNGNVADIARVPDTTYQTIRIGARLGFRLGRVSPYVGGENRIVLSGGDLERRFTTNPGRVDTTGFGLRGGFDLRLWRGKIAARLEGHYARFSWTFRDQLATAMYRADGGTDLVYGTSIVVGYAY